ncbi:MAG: MBL fold metallo-hydrolase [Patescibacteria group bacterium]|nr:MBL fold metallo-hydrolase [Patescibacteria group bacterium]MDE1966335.1 MBL fold metallo-hydrolase [Patescibacteria group bacterium]
MALRLTPYGGAGTVTGSNFMVETGGARVLVDCGMEQGTDFCEKQMYGRFPYDPSTVDALVLTHAHLDHVGRIPKLVHEGFRGKLYMTAATKDLAELILQDSVGILFEDAKRLGMQPLFTQEDVDATFPLIETLDYHTEKEIAPGISCYLRNTGHILGSASVRLTDTADGTTLALTGDLGNSPSPLLPDWEAIPDADAILMESVYGDRLHPGRDDRVLRLRDTLKAAIARGGNILMPAFSIERTQLMLYELSNFFAAGELPKIPVYLDSPLAINVTRVYEKWGPTYFKPEAEDEMKREGSLFEFPFLTKTLSREESRGIERDHRQKLIIAGAGMSHGGRIGIWERKYLPDPKSSLIIVGYQAPGSPGRRMESGAPRVTLGGEEVAIRAHVDILEGWSGHADRDGLLSFAEKSLESGRTKTIFVALGEPSAERFLAQRIHDFLGATAIVPDVEQSWLISKDSVTRS